MERDRVRRRLAFWGGEGGKGEMISCLWVKISSVATRARIGVCGYG